MIDICGIQLVGLNYEYEYIKKYSDIKITTKVLIIPFELLKDIDILKDNIIYIVIDNTYSSKNQLYTFSKDISIYIAKDKFLIQKINYILENLLSNIGTQNLIINEELNEVIMSGNKIKLTLKEINVLKYLSDNKDKLCSREDILVDVLKYHVSSDSRIVDVYIRYLRKKLGQEGKKIKTIRGKGYIYES